MLVVCLYLLTLVSAEFIFKNHKDFQKISEIIFRNEKYNVLKPTIHTVKDHFKDFMEKRHFEDVRPIYLDHNGFRHLWEGMEPRPHSLRKTDIIVKEAEEVKITDDNNTMKVKNKPRRKKKRIEDDVYVPEKPNLRDKSTLITTTFFCPFFGVISMSTNVENFEDNKTEQ